MRRWRLRSRYLERTLNITDNTGNSARYIDLLVAYLRKRSRVKLDVCEQKDDGHMEDEEEENCDDDDEDYDDESLECLICDSNCASRKTLTGHYRFHIVDAHRMPAAGAFEIGLDGFSSTCSFSIASRAGRVDDMVVKDLYNMPVKVRTLRSKPFSQNFNLPGDSDAAFDSRRDGGADFLREPLYRRLHDLSRGKIYSWEGCRAWKTKADYSTRP